MLELRGRHVGFSARLQVSVGEARAVQVLQAAEHILRNGQDHVFLHALRELQGTQQDDALPLNGSVRTMQMSMEPFDH